MTDRVYVTFLNRYLAHTVFPTGQLSPVVDTAAAPSSSTGPTNRAPWQTAEGHLLSRSQRTRVILFCVKVLVLYIVLYRVWLNLMRYEHISVGIDFGGLEHGAHVDSGSTRDEEFQRNNAISEFGDQKLDNASDGIFFFALIKCIQYDNNWRRK